MQRNLHRGGLSVAAFAFAFALGLGLISVPSARAEDPEPKPEVAAPEEPREITGADFAIQANAVEDRLSQIRNEMSVIDVAEEVNAALDEIEAEGAELQEQFNALETRRMMISELNALRVQIELLDARTKRQIDKLSVYAGDLEELETQNNEDIEVWTRAVRAIRKPSIPKSVRDRTASILQGLREGRKELDKKLGEVLALQTRALDVRDSVHIAEQGVMLAQREQAESIFERQDPPLWSTEPRPAEEALFLLNLGRLVSSPLSRLPTIRVPFESPQCPSERGDSGGASRAAARRHAETESSSEPRESDLFDLPGSPTAGIAQAARHGSSARVCRDGWRASLLPRRPEALSASAISSAFSRARPEEAP
jgi:hypothetical protein